MRFVSISNICLVLLAAFSFAGCSEVERLELPENTAEGTVSYKGKPVPYALIIFQGQSGSTTINADEFGKYKLEFVPEGVLQVGVNTDAGRGFMMGAMMAAGQQKDSDVEKPTFVDVPPKFFDPKTSGLTVTTNKGHNVLDIEVK